jgi:hypothetical protein
VNNILFASFLRNRSPGAKKPSFSYQKTTTVLRKTGLFPDSGLVTKKKLGFWFTPERFLFFLFFPFCISQLDG